MSRPTATARRNSRSHSFLLERLPHQQHQPPIGLERAGEVGERGNGVTEEHHPVAADHPVVAADTEVGDLRVRLLEPDVDQPLTLGPAPGEVEHPRGQVDAGDAAGGGEPRRLSSGQPDAAAHVEHVGVRRDRGRGEERLHVAGDPGVEGVGVVGPEVAGRPVPRGGDFGVRRVDTPHAPTLPRDGA
jgi:hypothetical protein